MAATVGYSRAVRVGPHVHVAGTAPIMPGEIDPPPDAYAQTKRSLEIILAALEQVGARFAEGGRDDLEATLRLAIRICGRGRAARHHGTGAGNEDVPAVADSPGEPDLRLVGRAGGDETPGHASSIARRWKTHFGRSTTGLHLSKRPVFCATARSSQRAEHGGTFCGGLR